MAAACLTPIVPSRTASCRLAHRLAPSGSTAESRPPACSATWQWPCSAAGAGTTGSALGGRRAWYCTTLSQGDCGVVAVVLPLLVLLLDSAAAASLRRRVATRGSGRLPWPGGRPVAAPAPKLGQACSSWICRSRPGSAGGGSGAEVAATLLLPPRLASSTVLARAACCCCCPCCCCCGIGCACGTRRPPGAPAAVAAASAASRSSRSCPRRSPASTSESYGVRHPGQRLLHSSRILW